MEEKKEEGFSINAGDTAESISITGAPIARQRLIGARAKRTPKGFRSKSVGFRTSKTSYDMVEISAQHEGLCVAEYVRRCVEVFVLSGQVNLDRKESIDRMSKILNRNSSFLEVLWNVVRHHYHRR